MFQLLTTDQLINLCKSTHWTRKIKQLHVHHTWSPDHADYNGKNGVQLQLNMWTYHTKTRGWSDIGQHLTLLPDGQWVTGRDFNKDPASITGWNEGAFAIEMLGNFDIGHDKFEGKQAAEMFKFCSFFLKLHKLNFDKDLLFHRDSSTAHKTCPGTGIDKAWFISMIKVLDKTDLLTEAVKFFNGKVGIDVALWSGTDYTKKAKYIDDLLIKLYKGWKGV